MSSLTPSAFNPVAFASGDSGLHTELATQAAQPRRKLLLPVPNTEQCTHIPIGIDRVFHVPWPTSAYEPRRAEAGSAAAVSHPTPAAVVPAAAEARRSARLLTWVTTTGASASLATWVRGRDVCFSINRRTRSVATRSSWVRAWPASSFQPAVHQR